MLSNRDLLNKKRMATLQELEKNFNEVKSNVDSLQKQMREVKKEIKKYEKKVARCVTFKLKCPNYLKQF